MSEKSEQTKKKLAQNADKITIAVLALILLGLGYFWWQEQNSGLGAADTTGKPASLQDPLADSPTLQMLQTMSPDPNLSNDESAQRIAQFSMFDSSATAQELAAENQAQAQVGQARSLIEQGQTDQAREILEEVLRVARYNKEAVKLMNDITTPTETAAPMDGAPMTEPMY